MARTQALQEREHKRQGAIGEALERLYEADFERVTVRQLADELYPNSIKTSKKDLDYNVSTGAARKALEEHRAAKLAEDGKWEIVIEFLPSQDEYRD